MRNFSILIIFSSLFGVRWANANAKSFCAMTQEASLIMEANALAWEVNKKEITWDGKEKSVNILNLEQPKRVFKTVDSKYAAPSRRFWAIYWPSGSPHFRSEPSNGQPVIVFIKVLGPNFTGSPDGYFWLDPKTKLWMNKPYYPNGIAADELGSAIQKCDIKQ